MVKSFGSEGTKKLVNCTLFRGVLERALTITITGPTLKPINISNLTSRDHISTLRKMNCSAHTIISICTPSTYKNVLLNSTNKTCWDNILHFHYLWVMCMMSISSSTNKIVPKPIQSDTDLKWTYRTLFYCTRSPSLAGKKISNISL
jgi:hypothetical protein